MRPSAPYYELRVPGRQTFLYLVLLVQYACPANNMRGNPTIGLPDTVAGFAVTPVHGLLASRRLLYTELVLTAPQTQKQCDLPRDKLEWAATPTHPVLNG